MKNILVIGAGRSSSSLIKYFLDRAQENNWFVIVGDIDETLAQQKVNKHTNAKAIRFDSNDIQARQKYIASADIVVSMLPAAMHFEVAKDCLLLKKNLITASYVSPEMAALHEQVKKNGLLFMNEMGLDPGLDHMSAMQIIDEIKENGGEIVSFKSYCGGLVAPQSNNNPWGYKFSWNPRNVILAGQATARYLENGKLRFLNYHNLFKSAEIIKVDGYGQFDAYANRDSLSYIKPYGIESAQTVVRGTLRQKNYCNAWNVLVQMGLTDDSFVIENANKLSYKEFTTSFIKHTTLKDYIIKELKYTKANEVLKMIDWLDLMSTKKIPLKNATPAQILQDLLEKKWLLKKNDLDMIVMQHEFVYKQKRAIKHLHSSLVQIGHNQQYTAMANTVGLPLAIGAKLILQGKIKLKGVHIPIHKEIYTPILAELKQDFGISFKEKKGA